MKMNLPSYSRFISLSLVVALGLVACVPISRPEPTAGLDPQTPSAPTATVGPQENPTATRSGEVVQETATQAGGPVCTVLQDVKVYPGPGTAYRPPIKVIPANTQVSPIGFHAQGIPEGSWVFIQDRSTLENGWVSASPQFISCTVDLAALPSVPVGTPPPPALPKSAFTTTPEGNCGNPYDCEVILTDEAFIQVRILKDGNALTEDEGVEQVKFTVRTLDGSTVIYTNTETASGYCIFGGPVTCDPWNYENDVYTWGTGGETVQSGEYNLTIEAVVNGDFLFWTVDFELVAP